MELKQYQIHRRYQKAEASSQIAVGGDYSIPEGKPDVSAILQKRPELLVDEVHTEKGKIKIRGKLLAAVLYLTERARERMACVNMEFPFEEVLYMEGAVSGDNLKIHWNIEELKVTIIHPGKLSVRGLVVLKGMITSAENCQITERTEDLENIYEMKEPFSWAEPVMECKESYRMSEEILLPANKPNVQNVLWKDLQVCGLELRPQDGRLAVKGEALLWVIYESEEEPASVHWMEQNIPFQGNLEVPGLTAEMFGLLETEISHKDIELKPDYDGEMRMFQIELRLDIPMHLYEERSGSRLKDAYSTGKQLTLITEEVLYEKLRMCNQAKCRINRQEKLGEDVKILQVLGHQAKLQEKNRMITDGGVLCEGVLEVQILYVTANDRQPFENVTLSVPYSQIVEVPGMTSQDTWKISENLEQLLISVAESNQLEIRGVIQVNACVMEQCVLGNVTMIAEEDYDTEIYKKEPAMRIHFVQPGETLWSIAKIYRSTVEDIKKLNDFTEEDVVSGQKLLLLKPVVNAVDN